MYQEIEQSILDRLKPLEEVRLLVRPEVDRLGQSRKAELQGEIIVSWLQDIAGEKTDFVTDETAQSITQEWRILLRMGNLRKVNGAYSVMEYITARLLGFRPPFCQQMYLQSRSTLPTQDDDQHRLREYEMLFRVDQYIVSAELEEREAILLKTIAFNLGAEQFAATKDSKPEKYLAVQGGEKIENIGAIALPSPLQKISFIQQ